MNYLGKFINNFRYAYKEINSATLTGAIDVVVVEQPDGTFTCSPFHVRFGKLGVLRSREKIVEIEINGEPLNIYMKLGESGEAFFVEEVDDDISIPEHLICSPIPDSEESGDQELFCSDLNHNEYNHVKKHKADKEHRELFDDDKNADNTEQLQSAVENISSIDNLQINDDDFPVDDNTKTNLTEGRQKQLINEQENIATPLKASNGAALFPANGIILPENIIDNSQNDVYQSLSVSENVVIGVPEIGFRPIRSISDSEGYYVTSKDEKDTANLEGLKVNRKLNSGNVKKRRKKKMRKPASKNHDSLSTNVNNNEDEDKHVVNPNDSHDNTSNQGDDLIEDEIVDHEVVDLKDLNNQIPTSAISDLHFFSDTEVTANSSLHERTFSPIQSDTEFEITSRQTEGDGRRSLSETGNSPLNFLARASWKWGEFPSAVPKSESYDPPADKIEVETKRSALASMLGFMKRTKHIRQKTSELEDGGIYLSQLITNELDPEIARLYLPHSSGSDTNTVINDNKESITHIKNVSQISSAKDDVKDNDDSESRNRPSLIQSGELDANQLCDNYTKSDGSNLKIDISLCGNLYTNDKVPAEDLFDKHLITYEQFVNDPAIFKNPNVVFRINTNIYKWETACPLILSMALFGKPLPEEVLNRLEQEKSTSKLEEEKRSHRRGYYSWFNWARSRQHKSKDDTGKTVLDANVKSIEKAPIIPPKPSSALVASANFDAEITNIIGEGMELNTPTPLDYDAQRMRTYSSTDSEYEPDILDEKPPERYRKSLRLSSQQIASLNLRDGSNEVVFSVTTAYQGTTRCWCNLFKWRYDDKIVVSDIDGTITKSDVLGHILPIVGNDWAQNGVARLFNKIKDNGYQLLYLSSRAIGQSKGTRKYLCSIKQEDLTLPEGPLLLNPTSLLSAFHREVIEKKPEKFKISCLRDIQALFPPDSNPFYAGYGNRINDVWAYQAVGIPIFRIFTINHRGELKHELTQTFQSSYTNMSQIADQLFPVQAKRNTAEDYSEFNYWREPLPNVEEGLLKELKIA